MRSGLRWGLLLLVPGFLSGIGCASHPITRVAQEGSTVAIPIGFQTGPDTFGYGGLWLETLDPPLFDDQRGRLTFTFTKDSWSSDPIDPLLVSRMFPDPSTRAAQRSEVQLIAEVFELPLVGQVVAVVTVPDVPVEVTCPLL